MTEQSLRTKLIRLAHAKPELRGTLLPLLKQASLSYKRERIDIPTAGGQIATVDALAYGSWSIYKNLSGNGWAVTLTKTGQAATTRSRTLKEAQAYLETLLERAPALIHADSENDIIPYLDVFKDLRKNPPTAAGGTPRQPRVTDRREDVIKQLLDAGLSSMGGRYGKAGEFFAYGHEAPAWAISVGRRDVLLNYYIPEQRLSRGYVSWTGRWNLSRAELISKVSPETLNKWVAFLKKAPTREQEQEKVLARDGNRRPEDF